MWCTIGPALPEPLEEGTGIRANVKECAGAGAGLAILERSRPGDRDVPTVDPSDGPRLVDAGVLARVPA